MKRLLLTLFVVLGAVAQEVRDLQIPAGMAAAHMIGRMVVSPDGTAELIGYYPFLEGVEGSLFSAPEAAERTAHFTFRSSRFRVTVLRNDPLTHMRTVPVEGSAVVLRVYFNPSPNQDFARPASFSAGELVAEYQARGSLTTIVPLTSTVNTGSFRRISAADFTFREQTYNLGRMAENITVELKGAPLDFALSIGGASIPFGGTAVAAGAVRSAY